MQKLNSLGFAKAEKNTRVVVAMSGGIDSSVVAAQLFHQGYEVIGITLQLYDHGAAVAKKGACCAGRDIHDARRVAASVGFVHYVLDYESAFRAAVIDQFADSYLAGTTPVPCIRCNERIKFRDLLHMARDLKADCMATGHYIRRLIGACGPELHRAVDVQRDQSYFLFSTRHQQLEYLRFPLGALQSKAQTRSLAKEFGLSIANKPDSQDICFVVGQSYARVVEKLRPDTVRAGNIVDLQGRILGQHTGIINYTVGQRRGLGIGGGDRLYVIKLDAKKHEVVVGPNTELLIDSFIINQINWLGDAAFDSISSHKVAVRVRSTGLLKNATLHPIAGNKARVELEQQEEAIAPGQACVFYQRGGTRVYGGGWIYKHQ